MTRSRRIKCDESKPSCCRCKRSNVKCEGYPLGAYSDSENAPSPDQPGLEVPKRHSDAILTQEARPAYAPLDGFRRSSTQDRLARLGCGVLRDGLHDQFEVSRAVFECLLPQLSYALPSVNAAAAALGAVYEMQTAPLGTVDGKTWLVVTQYGAAIREVQQELCNRPYGAVPILVACLLLACADVLLRRPRFALMHLQGAIRLLEERNGMSTLAPGSIVSSDGVSHRLTSNTDPLPLEEGDDEITALFRTLDVQTVSYADGRRPRMQIALVRTSQDAPTSPISVYRTSRDLIALMQACYCFTSYASHFKYLPQVLVPAELFIEQGRQIAALKQWLRRLTYDILPYVKPSSDSTRTATAEYTHCLMLRNLCLSTIIYASTILDPYETGWDIHALDFQEIITGAELILENRRRKRCGALSSSTTAFTFTPAPGIIQPLYLTVLKYRHPKWRRRALELLRESGKEGPWDGNLMAAVVQCAVEIEESELLRHADSSVEHLENIVPERVRISGCGPDEDTDGIIGWESTKDGRNMSHVGSTSRWILLRVRLSRCKDVDRMLVAGLEIQEPGGEAAFTHKRHWEKWIETVEFSCTEGC